MRISDWSSDVCSSDLMVLAGRFADDFADARGFGWNLGSPRHDWTALIAAKDKEISRLEDLYIQGLESSGVELRRARASIVDPHTVCLDDSDKTISARHILVATGGHAVKDHTVEGIEHAVPSDAMYDLRSEERREGKEGGSQ